MKPDWSDAPEWANHLAMDEDGCWYWYELKPTIGSYAWRPQGPYNAEGNRYLIAAPPRDRWRETLESRP